MTLKDGLQVESGWPVATAPYRLVCVLGFADFAPSCVASYPILDKTTTINSPPAIIKSKINYIHINSITAIKDNERIKFPSISNQVKYSLTVNLSVIRPAQSSQSHTFQFGSTALSLDSGIFSCAVVDESLKAQISLILQDYHILLSKAETVQDKFDIECYSSYAAWSHYRTDSLPARTQLTEPQSGYDNYFYHTWLSPTLPTTTATSPQISDVVTQTPSFVISPKFYGTNQDKTARFTALTQTSWSYRPSFNKY